MYKKKLWLIILPLLLALTLAGCALKQKEEGAFEPAPEAVTEEVQQPDAMTESKENPADHPEEEKEPMTGTPEEDLTGKPSLAKRLCGKYSILEGDEYLGLEILSFGDNLYGFAGYQMTEEEGEEPEEFEYYSYWACEWIPVDPEVLQSPEADSVEVYELVFSNMANAGKYQTGPLKCTLRLDEDGIVLESFGQTRQKYKKDERAEDAFPYLKEAEAPEEEDPSKEPDLPEGEELPEGFYRSVGGETPIFLKFEEGTLSIFRKQFDTEVSFLAGAFSVKGEELKGRLSALGSGAMPVELNAEFRTEGDRLFILDKEYGDVPFFHEEQEFVRVKEEDLPVIGAGDAIRYIPGKTQEEDLLEEDPLQEPFYGIFVSSMTDYEGAVKLCRKVKDQGYDSMVIYTPEWEKLNPEPYFCVTAGRYETQQKAEDALSGVQKVYPDAYVKFTGACKGTQMNYVNYGLALIESERDMVVMKYLDMEPTFQWDPALEEDPEKNVNRLWIIDGDTVFAPSCETEFFGNYEEGDTVLQWFQRNILLQRFDPETYATNGPALEGVFYVTVTGNHIDEFLGCYWWD